MVLFNILLGVIILVAFMLILVVMVQQPKGSGLSSTFGGNAQVVGGVKKTGDFLEKSTWTLGASLIILIIFANIVLSNNRGITTDSRVLDGHKEVPQTPTNTPQVPQIPTN